LAFVSSQSLFRGPVWSMAIFLSFARLLMCFEMWPPRRQIQFVSHRKHITSPLQSQPG
jgi:hypothetical protein